MSEKPCDACDYTDNGWCTCNCHAAPDPAYAFAKLTPDNQNAYATGALHTYRKVMDNIAAGYQAGGLDAVYVAVRRDYYETKAMLEIEGRI